jgi:hypothetical protein
MIHIVKRKFTQLKKHLKYSFYLSINKNLIEKLIRKSKNKSIIQFYFLKDVCVDQENLFFNSEKLSKGINFS